MKIEIKVPEVGESVQEALLAEWYRRDGDLVRKGDILFLIETDKVTLEVAAEESGVLNILVPTGVTVSVGKVVGTIDSAAVLERKKTPAVEEVPDRPGSGTSKLSEPGRPPEAQTVRAGASEEALPQPGLTPSVRQLLEEKGLNPADIPGTGPGGRITRGDVFLHLESSPEEAAAGGTLPTAPEPSRPAASAEPPVPAGPKEVRRAPPGPPEPAAKPAGAEEEITRRPLSPIRRRIAERLLEARRNTAMLTTFNEIDMGRVQELRGRFKEAFREKYGVSLGIMSFFIKASIEALREFPEVNAFIDGTDVVYHHYYHIGVAVGAERGLVVPVVCHADRLGFAGIERAISDYVRKIRENRLELADLEGGTFTVSNGGIYGSLLSTPILNTPQSGILGLHKIEERPVVADGRIVARPMMYVALSYDHRIVDGREAVSFLKRIKDCVETPERIMMEI
ncbi:MAG: 2-oxoglutarate dehydrogenase complex dihydrolipoyllysine-residue succinyltransferase [Desulfobacteraceae bacterium]|nr:2-oxoglutarate dehydrogenase complex dihydrolipoyllysine-residue succinyltransferase [Desulfobacteraceae bacterium]